MAIREEETVSLADAKARFAECIRRVEEGRALVLTRHGRPVARLVPLAQTESDAEWAFDSDHRREANEIRERRADYDVLPTGSLSDARARRTALQRLLEDEIWPQIPTEMIGRSPTKKEREEILGIHEDSP